MKMQDEREAVLIVDLTKRERELEVRRKELESLLAGVSKEEKAIKKRLGEIGGIKETTLPMTQSDWDRMQYSVYGYEK
jgi:energy-converting hydrogenase Eha subunit H